MNDLTETDPRTYPIIGAAMEVHRNLGCGFLEPIYQEALTIEFLKREIPFQREIKFPVFYKDIRLRSFYRPDFICFDGVVVELKALARIGGIEEAQVRPAVVKSACFSILEHAPSNIDASLFPSRNLRNLRIVFGQKLI